MRPMIRAPTTGTSTTSGPRWLVGRRDQRRVPALIEEEVGEQADQAQERQRHESAQDTDAEGGRRDQEDAPGGREVAQIRVGLFITQALISPASVRRGRDR